MNLKDPSSRLMRWKIRIEEFDYTTMYKKGKSNTNADALSRIPIVSEEIVNSNTETDHTLVNVIQTRSKTAPFQTVTLNCENPSA